MNPFGWTGPEFLAFYLILAAACLGAQYWMRSAREAEAYPTGSPPPLNDPYLVSYLAGRANGLVRCVTVALIERNVLKLTSTGKNTNTLVMDSAVFRTQVQSQLEGAVARFFEHPREAHAVFQGLRKDPMLTMAGAQYQSALESAGMMPNAEQRGANRRDAVIAASILAVAAGLKIALALEHGHRNVGFLIVLAILSCLGAGFIGRAMPTRPGKEALEDLRHLFGGLKQQAKTGTGVSPADVAFVAAVFGVAALGGGREVYAKSLFPSSSSSGCGSGCGSSDGGGGGGSCGGGGCGGCGGG